jgi:NADH-quinone oxidoreductase subunit A
MEQYLPILILIAIAVLLAVSIVFLSFLFGPRKDNPVKLSIYESGVKPFTDARLRFNVRFYIIVILFVLFDIEVIFMYPWAVVYRDLLSLGWFIFIEMMVFIGILLAGYIYILKKGALDWE